MLAYRLQNEESECQKPDHIFNKILIIFCEPIVSSHYEGNRSKNRTVREDLPLARGMQRNEEEEASAVRLSYERILEQQLEEDERVAREIQDRLLEQDYTKRRAEEEDERLAKRLAEKERARLLRKRLEREKQQVERLSSQVTTHVSTDSPNSLDNQEMGAVSQCVDAMHIRDRQSLSLPSDDDELDLSEFCLQPPPNLSPEELRIFLEEQDAEIARLLQQQEMKRKSTVDKEKLAQIEAQDFEIAKLLQKQEKERLRRLKERAKQRQLQKQLEMTQTNNTIISNPNANHNNGRHSDNSCDNYSSIQRQSNGTYNSGAERLGHQSAHNQYSDNDSIHYEEIGQQSYHTNIATFLDPTYKRNSTSVPPNPLLNPSPVPRNNYQQNQDFESNVDDNEPEEPGIHFAQVYQVTPTPSPSESPYSTNQRLPNRPMLRDPEPVPIEDNYYPIEEVSRRNRVSPTSPVPPYLPVQGQRRISSMEKKKKSKDNCKTQ